MHDNVPAKAAFAHVNVFQCLAANQSQRPEIGESKSPAVLDQFADEAITKALHRRHRFASRFGGKAICHHQVRVALGRRDHQIDIIEVIAAVGIAKKNPGDTARHIR